MILLLLALNIALLLTGVLLVLFKMDSGRGSGYIIEFRSSVGLGDFKTGSAIDMFSFVIFMFTTFVINILLSLRVFVAKRQLAVAILAMGILLQLLAVIVSNALLALR